jgi:phosphatidylinositol phospholipase C delta
MLVDIFDGDHEPMIYHGKTLTSKVSLREVCEVIKKYGFVASPYPIILSAEVHCSLAQQDMIAAIMIEVFEDTLVQEPLEELADGRKIEVLPSPEQLKGKILLKVGLNTTLAIVDRN